MGRPRKSKSSKATASAPAADDDKKFYIHAQERDTLFGLDNTSDNDADTSTNVVSAPTRKANRNKKLKGHDLVGTLDDLANADHVFDLDLPSDSDVSDEDTSSKARRDYVLPEEDDEGTGVKRSGWGKRRGVFYNADDTFADDEAAKMEEQEAQRLRKERLNKLKEEDFLDGAFGTLVGANGSSTISLPSSTEASTGDTMEIIEQRPRSDMSKDEILELLATSSPDLLEFILEYQSKLEDLRDALSPMYTLAQRMEPEGSPVRTYLQTKYFTVLGFLLNVTFYLALYAKGVPRREITRHPVVSVLVQLKQQLDAIEKVESEKPWLAEQLEPIIAAIEDMDELEMGVDEYVEHVKKELEREMKEEEEEEEKDDEDEEMADDSDVDADQDLDAMSEDEGELASDLDAMDIDSDDEDEMMPQTSSKAPVKRKRSATTNSSSDDDDSDAPDLDAALASLPAKKRKRLAAHLAAVADADDDFESLKQDAKQASRRQKRVPSSSAAALSTASSKVAAEEADFDETAGDANYGEQRSAFASMMPKKSLKKIVQSVQTAAKSKKAVSADSDVAKQSRKAAQLNAHLSKEAMAEAERDADVFSDGEHDEPTVKNAKAKAAAPKGNFNEIGINMDKVDPQRPISSLVEARAKKLAIKKDKVAKKVAAREGISVDEARKQVKFDGESDDDADMNDMGQKREASYKILKNKGLTPKRKKEDRNPRVKHRRKFETKMKKLKTVKRMVTDLKTGYQGELTGIKTHLTRQVNLK